MKGLKSTKLDGSGLRIAIASARWNDFVGSRLLEGAHAALRERGVIPDDITTVTVPGAFELPFAAKRMADTGKYDAVVCLGAVIRGETPHFHFVAGEAARGIMKVGLDTGIPVLFGLITADTEQQAIDRAGGKAGNKGREAAEAAVEMALFNRHRTADSG
ncbi:MAG: 6,7-dimethyl-8-ribityllumazine synthase [Rhodothermia bacterium]